MNLQELKDRLRDQLIQDGTEFRKCANCGCEYPLGAFDWTDETVCGERCFAAYLAYLNNPDSY